MKKVILILIFVLCPLSLSAEWNCVWENDSIISVQKGLNGRIKVWSEIVKNEEGKQVSKRVETHEYYPAGEIKKINQKVYDSKNVLKSERNINHYTDNRPPVVIEQKAVK